MECAGQPVHALMLPHVSWGLPPVPQIKVCIVDSGILSFHQDLQDNWAGGWNRMPRGQFMPVPGTADYTNLSGEWLEQGSQRR